MGWFGLIVITSKQYQEQIKEKKMSVSVSVQVRKSNEARKLINQN